MIKSLDTTKLQLGAWEMKKCLVGYVIVCGTFLQLSVLFNKNMHIHNHAVAYLVTMILLLLE